MLRSIGKQSRKSVESVLKKKKELATVGTVASTRVQGCGGTSLVSRLSACLTKAKWWRLIAE